jgi:hypothetical protein
MNDYISLFQNQLLKPYLNKVDENGKKKYDKDSAMKELQKRLINQYLY